jgi:hemerythrin superfamily protein
MPNGIDLILADHRRVETLFDMYEQTNDASYIGQVIDALQAHDDVEQAALYPLAGNVLGDVDLIQRSAAAHSFVKKQIEMLRTREGLPLVEAFLGLRDMVAEHVADEENNLLPALRETATSEQLDGLGARILQGKQRVG